MSLPKMLAQLKTSPVQLTLNTSQGAMAQLVGGILWDVFEHNDKCVALLLETVREVKPNIVPQNAVGGAIGKSPDEQIQNFYLNLIDVDRIVGVRIMAGFYIDITKRAMEQWPKAEIYKDSPDDESTRKWREGITRQVEKQLQSLGIRPVPMPEDAPAETPNPEPEPEPEPQPATTE